MLKSTYRPAASHLPVKRPTLLLVLTVLFVLLTHTPPSANAAEPVDFARDILPVLSDNCFQCHGFDPKEGRKGDLRLDDEADATRERGEKGLEYHVIKPGDAKASELLYRLTTDDPDEQMPPPKLGRVVTPEEIEKLRRWIDEGATWGKHWAFEPVVKPKTGSEPEEDKHPIDHLVERRLTAANAEAEASTSATSPLLLPTPRAKRATLIRRLLLDLTGLPPTPEQTAAFLADESAQAWERLVDQTLASPAYGERMAWDWLEAARYADTNGYQGDRERNMWPWRDWVVDAFNRNLPYDDFTVWQLAGDLLPDATHEQILATAFNRNYMINGEGGRIPEENRVEYVFDMTETMGTIWLGLTLNCCRCHDHKFDPLTQREYFQFTAFFNQTPVTGGGGDPATKPVLEVQTAQIKRDLAKEDKESNRLGHAIKKRRDTMAKQFERWTEAKTKELAAQPSVWRKLAPALVKAEDQKIEIVDKHRIITSGNNPANDSYEIELPLDDQFDGPLRAVKLDAIKHPSMTAGGLARSDSSNFVLTDITFDLVGKTKTKTLEIESAKASFEQDGHPISLAFDGDKKKGWAVWNGKKVDRDHAAIFHFRDAPTVDNGATLRVRMLFGSRHPSHNLGHFSLSATSQTKDKAGLPDEKNKVDTAFAQALQTPAAKRSTEQKASIRKAFEAEDERLTKLDAKRTAINKRIADLRKRIPNVMVMEDMAKPRPTYILDRGLYTARGEEIGSDTPAFLPPMPELASGEATNRLALARWLVDPENPLTARVTVNRTWQMLFGIGLVKTVEDFGVQAEYPVQRELLDWLAAEFVESGWDMKQLIRTIVTSEVYQRSSDVSDFSALERDPANRLLARGPRFRMPSWMIRDQALAASGLLNDKRGGPSVNSYQPEGIWAEATFGKKKYNVASGDDLYRRSLYTYWRRIIGPTMFFDTAKRQVCEVKPLRTNTPMHALSTLNGVTFVEAARVLAGSLLEEEKRELEARQTELGRRVLGRAPSTAERAIWKQSLERASKHFRAHPDEAKTFLAHGDSKPRAGLDPVEHAAWTALCLNVLNLDETLTKE